MARSYPIFLYFVSRVPFLSHEEHTKNYTALSEEHFQLEIERRGNKRDGYREEEG